jgi:hypothetical protein
MRLLRYLWSHRTKTLGFIQVTLGVLATADGLFSPMALKIIILCSGLATAYVGFFNTRTPKPAREK